MIVVKHLDKYFNRGKKNSIHVLNDVSLTFPDKGLHVLLGPSGSGKTTLLNVIGGLDSVQKGEIDFFDHKIKKYNASVWDKIRTEEVGYIFQNYYLMPALSVFDNVAFVLKMIGISDKEEIKKRVDYILQQVGMYQFRKKRSTQLSGGQQQRVAIARALVKNPKVIIADEPTGNLDSKNTFEIMNMIKTISANKLVILVTHEREIADFYGDRVIEIRDGEIVSDRVSEKSEDHNFGSENTIYLKDLNKVADLKSEGLKASLYHDSDEIEPAEIRLIVKNKTLYLDIKTDIKKIKILGQDAHNEVKDAHFAKKTREEIMATTFDDSFLDHSGLKKQKQVAISFKNSFLIAFKRFMNIGKKGKMMMSVFVLSGMLMGYATINLYTIATQDHHDMLTIDDNYLAVDTAANVPAEASPFLSESYRQSFLNKLNTETGGEYKLIVDNSAVGSQYQLDLGNGSYKYYSSRIRTEYAVQLSTSDLYAGRLPLNRNEIVVGKGFYGTGGLNDTLFQDVGIWDVKDLIGEVLADPQSASAMRFSIVGVADVSRSSAFVYDYYAAAYISDLLLGKLDTLATNHDFENALITHTAEASTYVNKILIYSKSPQSLLASLDNANYVVTQVSAQIAAENKAEVAKQLATNLVIMLFFVGGGLLAFYFVMRSSMISRIYDISVYRALGVRKYEIYGSFSVEIIMLTTISTLVGFFAMAIILSALSGSLLGILVSFKVDAIILLLGTLFVYAANLLIGLLPTALLLRKTTSQIISSYDI